MTVVQGYLWLCFGSAVIVSLAIGLLAFIGVPGKGRGARPPWPLMVGIVCVCLALQAGYIAAPLALRAEGDWWRWAVYGMAPVALGSLLGVTGSVGRFVRCHLHDRRRATLRTGVLTGLALQSAVYIGAPIVVWLSRA